MTFNMKNAAFSLSRAFNILKAHKIITSLVSVVLVLSISLSIAAVAKSAGGDAVDAVSDSSAEASTEVSSVESEPITSSVESEVSSEVSSVSSAAESSKVSSVTSSKKASSASSKKTNTTSKKTSSAAVKNNASTKPISTSYKYNSNTDINDNVFLDSLVYTGYNLKKHISDGMMWKYVLASQKRGRGWLSDITYAGGSTGYETKNGKPDIKAFERKGLVCASYVTYVYFNYLPHVAGIDTSSLTKPKKSYSANDWYIAAKDWVKKGYSTTISFKASKTSSGYINFKPSKDIPIGSIMVFCDAYNRSDYCSHVAIYAGYKNGYNWVYHVGNENGPEFCAVERMHFGPDPQWPIKVITTPSNIRMQAAVEITLKDDSSKPIAGAKFSLKNLETGKTVSLGKTNSKGVIVKENLPYGKYQLIQSEVKGYTAKKLTRTLNLTTANNSYNKISITNTKIKETVSSVNKETESGKNNTSSKVSSSETVTSSKPSASSDTAASEDTSTQPDVGKTDPSSASSGKIEVTQPTTSSDSSETE